MKFVNRDLVIAIVLFVETIVLMFKFRWDKKRKWYTYFLPFSYVKDVPKWIIYLYYIFTLGGGLIIWRMIDLDNWIFKMLALSIILLFMQYALYGIFWLSRVVLDIILCLDDLSFVICIFAPSVLLILPSIESGGILVRIIWCTMLVLCVVDMILMLRHLLAIVTKQEYKMEIVNRYYLKQQKIENSVIRMKLEIVFTEYVILVMQLSFLVYLVSNISPNIDWVYEDYELVSYIDCLYYAITSFTSVGYGSIVLNSFIAKGVDIIISCIGLVFVGCIMGLILENDDFVYEKEKRIIEVKYSIDKEKKNS